MVISIFGYLFLFVGFLILFLPLVLVELSRPRDWLMGGLFLFLGLFLLLENDLLRGSINLFVISMAVLYVLMMSEIIQTRWNQLSVEEKKRIGSFERWLESFKQLGQIFTLVINGCLNFFQSFISQSEKPLSEKKWVRPESIDKSKRKEVLKSDSTDSNKIRNQELNENEETS